MPNAHALILHLLIINCALLVFNLMPVYPLDGGQILRSLLWFVLGRARSLMVATIVGFIGVAGLVAIAVFFQDMWIAIMTVFILLNCWGGLMQARRLARLAKLPHHTGFACPTCREPPPKGTFWVCHPCRVAFDTFETQGACPRCGALFPVTQCLECGATHPIGEWTVPPPLVPR